MRASSSSDSSAIQSRTTKLLTPDASQLWSRPAPINAAWQPATWPPLPATSISSTPATGSTIW